MVKFVNLRTPEDIARAIANEFITQLQIKKNSVFGFATGSTPIPLYKELIKDYENNLTDYCLAKSVNLNEYIGLSADNEQSYAYFMRENLFNHINIAPKNVHIPSGTTPLMNYEKVELYQKILDSIGTRDIQILGIGTNGHIGFNEPSKFFNPNTHVVTLDSSTINSNSRFFDSLEDVPRMAITMGIRDILNSRKLILIATGKSKAHILSVLYTYFIDNKVDPLRPATSLFLHPDCTIYYDEEAGQYLSL